MWNVSKVFGEMLLTVCRLHVRQDASAVKAKAAQQSSANALISQRVCACICLFACLLVCLFVCLFARMFACEILHSGITTSISSASATLSASQSNGLSHEAVPVFCKCDTLRVCCAGPLCGLAQARECCSCSSHADRTGNGVSD